MNKSSVLNKYILHLDGLKIHQFEADEEWLDFVLANRRNQKVNNSFVLEECDVLLGPTADDKLFSTLDMYISGVLTKNETIRVINCMNFSEQILCRTQKAIDALSFESAKIISGLEKQEYHKQQKADSIEAAIRTNELLYQLRMEREENEPQHENRADRRDGFRRGRADRRAPSAGDAAR